MQNQVKQDHPAFKEFAIIRSIADRQTFLRRTIKTGSVFYSVQFKKERIAVKVSDSNVWLDGVRHSWTTMEQVIRKRKLEIVSIPLTKPLYERN